MFAKTIKRFAHELVSFYDLLEVFLLDFNFNLFVVYFPSSRDLLLSKKWIINFSVEKNVCQLCFWVIGAV